MLKNTKKLSMFFLFLIIFLLIFSSFVEINNAKKISNKRNNNHDINYLIKFKEKPLVTFKNEIKEKFRSTLSSLSLKSSSIFLTNKVNEYNDKLVSFHNQAKNQIFDLLSLKSSKNIFKYDFKSLFNGIVISNLEPNQIRIIENLPFVEKVIKEQKFKANLDDAIPIVRADDSWQLKDSYNRYIKGDDISIAILDSGIDYNHPALRDNYCFGGYDYINNDLNPMDDFGHGTMCAGIVAAIAPHSNIYSYKVLNNSGSGNNIDLMASIEDILDPNGDGDFSDRFIDIVSISFGDNSSYVTPDNETCLLIDNAVNEGLVVVAAAGNDGRENTNDRINSPGCSRKAITVGASNNYDDVADFSSWGPVYWDGETLDKPDIVAPGVNIYTTFLNNDYRSGDGTSYSTPIVSGAIALIKQAHPEWSPDEIKNKLKEHAVDLDYPDYQQGAGRIDIFSSLEIQPNNNEENDLIIDIPFDKTFYVNESETFNVKIKKEDNPFSAIVIFTSFLHKPQISFGSDVEFTAPEIKTNLFDKLNGKIWIIKLIDNEITTVNVKILNI